MPVVLRVGPYKFLFYASDRGEPPHVHAERDKATAKFWLDPARLDWQRGFSPVEIRRVLKIVRENEADLLRERHGTLGN